MKYELKSYTTGELFGSALNLYLNNFLVLFLIALSLGLVDFFLLIAMYAFSNGETSELVGYVILGAYFLLKLVLYATATGLITLIVYRKYLDSQVKVSELLPTALRLVFPLIGLGLLVYLIISIVSIVFIPFFIFVPALCFSITVRVIEGPGIAASIKRSWKLSKGSRLWIFWVLFLLLLIAIVYMVATTFVSTFLVQRLLARTPFFIQLLPQILLNTLGLPFGSCVIILMYFSVRIKKEGFELEHLADSFSLDYEVVD